MKNVSANNIKQFKNKRVFLDGSKRSVIIIDKLAIGYGKYKPGWKWSKHAGSQTEKKSAYHLGYIVSGKMVIKDRDGKKNTVGPNTVFEVAPGHDGWVAGKKPCVALDFYYKKGKINR
ncbi:MAG: cupin [Patescibacteria group bacterium]